MRNKIDAVKALSLVGFYIARVYWIPRSRLLVLPLAAGVALTGAVLFPSQSLDVPAVAEVKKTVLLNPVGANRHAAYGAPPPAN